MEEGLLVPLRAKPEDQGICRYGFCSSRVEDLRGHQTGAGSTNNMSIVSRDNGRAASAAPHQLPNL